MMILTFAQNPSLVIFILKWFTHIMTLMEERVIYSAWTFHECKQSRWNAFFFVTAIGKSREQYGSIFSKNIDYEISEVNMDKMTIKLLKLLITNSISIWLKKTEKSLYWENRPICYKCLSKRILFEEWWLSLKFLILDQVIEIDADDEAFVELNLRLASFSINTIALKKANFIEMTSDKCRKYKLWNYSLCPIK